MFIQVQENGNITYCCNASEVDYDWKRVFYNGSFPESSLSKDKYQDLNNDKCLILFNVSTDQNGIKLECRIGYSNGTNYGYRTAELNVISSGMC